MIYKIVLSNGKDSIPVAENDLIKVINEISKGGNVIITKEGIFNPSFYVGILVDNDRTRDESEAFKYDRRYLISPFAKLLSKKMSMIDSPRARTKIQEEVAKEERKAK